MVSQSFRELEIAKYKGESIGPMLIHFFCFNFVICYLIWCMSLAASLALGLTAGCICRLAMFMLSSLQLTKMYKI